MPPFVVMTSRVPFSLILNDNNNNRIQTNDEKSGAEFDEESGEESGEEIDEGPSEEYDDHFDPLITEYDD